MIYQRRKVREIAMQILFAWDLQAGMDMALALQVAQDGTDDQVARTDAVNTAEAAWAQLTTIDPWIERLAPKRPLRQQAAVDRALLRLAAWELLNTPTPPSIAIAEAIELAKEFSTLQSAAFVNGVLDSLLKEHLALIGKAKVQS